jgi:RNA polymerase sigma-70 factor (ECF subfamily)
VPAEDEGLIDLALARRAAADDREAFDALVGRHQASVFRLARLLTRSQEDAEDVLQQTFLSAWRHRTQFRAEASVRTWLLTIARNTALATRTRQSREPRDSTPLDELGMRAGWGGLNPEDLAIRGERHERLTAAFVRLPADDREILTLRDLEELSGDATAQLLGVSLPAMKSRLHRARLALAALVLEEDTHAPR